MWLLLCKKRAFRDHCCGAGPIQGSERDLEMTWPHRTTESTTHSTRISHKQQTMKKKVATSLQEVYGKCILWKYNVLISSFLHQSKTPFHFVFHRLSKSPHLLYTVLGTYFTKNLFSAFLKFSCNWIFCILSGSALRKIMRRSTSISLCFCLRWGGHSTSCTV